MKTISILIVITLFISCSPKEEDTTPEPLLKQPVSRQQPVETKEIKDVPDEASKNTQKDYQGMKTGVTSDGHYWVGDENATFEVKVFSDFQCPYCNKFGKKFIDFMKKSNTPIKLTFYNLPLRFHKNAEKLAKIAHCAGKSGVFWETHDYIFNTNPRGTIDSAYISKIETKFSITLNTCITLIKTVDFINNDLHLAKSLRIYGTPTFYLNNKKYTSTTIITAIKTATQNP
jgi:protein-disulfide isomerase